MYVDIVPNRNSRPAILLREGWRQSGKVKKRTIANLSHWPMEKVLALRRVLKNEQLVATSEAFSIEENIPHGHVEAILGVVKQLGLRQILSSRSCREQSLVLAMIVDRLIHPRSKLSTSRRWHHTTLGAELGVSDADEDELYKAMDWLIKRKGRIEKKLAAKHLQEGALALYDVSSSYYEGRTCSLARFGHNRDGKKGKRIIVYGVLCDQEGRPVGIEVYPGNTGDPSTVPDQVIKLQQRFGLENIVLVGDRGMLTQTQIEKLKEYPGMGWISALRGPAIRKLFDRQEIQLSLFDDRQLAEIISPEFPGERLMVCYNPLLAKERRRKREALLGATDVILRKLKAEVERRTKTPMTNTEIAQKLGKKLNKYKVGKHFTTEIDDHHFSSARDEESISNESALDGIYVVRTSEPKEHISAEDTVRSYKQLSRVERFFRTVKGVSILVRPIRHRAVVRVKAHFFICLLAYYIEWHMRKALAPLLFDDEELGQGWRKRDPVAQAQVSESAQKKKKTRKTNDGFPVYDFKVLIHELGKRNRNRCRLKSDESAPPFYQLTEMNSHQKRAFELLGLLPVT